MYCVGWVRRGPTGTIATNILDAREVVDNILKDLSRPFKSQIKGPTADRLQNLMKEHGTNIVDFNQSINIEKHERSAGEDKGKLSEKFNSVYDMLVHKTL